ncbi:MAG: hypothetical protein V1904_09945 [Bacteroidota bacterium]
MAKTGIQKLLAEQGNKAAASVAEILIKEPINITEIIKNLDSEKAKIKYGSSKVLFLLSEEKPELLYKYFDSFKNLLQGKNNIHKWTAIDILMNFSFVDSENKIDKKLFKTFCKLIENDSMITAGHIVANIWKLAVNNIFPADDIVKKLLYFKNSNVSSECNKILAGHIIDSFPKIYDMLSACKKKEVMAFTIRHLKNTRMGTRKKAILFLKSYSQKS